jgi:hypothetical protein
VRVEDDEEEMFYEIDTFSQVEKAEISFSDSKSRNCDILVSSGTICRRKTV